MDKLLPKIGTKKTFPKDCFIFQAGDQANGFYYITSGEVRVYRMDIQGKEVEIGRLGPEYYLGEAIVFVMDEYPVFAQAVKKTTCFYLPKDKIQNAIQQNAETAQFFITLLAKKCVALNQRIATLSLQTVRQRLVEYLKANQNQENKVILTISKKELAMQLATIPETLSRNLKQLQKEGVILVKNNEISLA